MTIKPFRALTPILEKINASSAFFETVKDDYPNFKSQNLFDKAEKPAIYFYAIETKKKTHFGVVASLDIRDYYLDKIKKHEKTLVEKERQQMALLIERGAMVKPVLLAYPEVDVLQSFMYDFSTKNEAHLIYSFPENSETHRFWAITDEDKIEKLQNFFSKNIPITYVADGHHRLTTNVMLYETMQKEAKNGEYDQILCAFFADTELSILPFHRVVKIEKDDLLQVIEKVADKRPTNFSTPTEKHHFAVFFQEEWHNFVWKKDVLDAFFQKKDVLLDVDILNDKILREILEIEDIRKDHRIIYVEGNKTMAALEQICQKHNAIGFSLFPVDIKDLMQVADNDGVMPPKSTWFEPRMKNGLLIQEIGTKD